MNFPSRSIHRREGVHMQHYCTCTCTFLPFHDRKVFQTQSVVKLLRFKWKFIILTGLKSFVQTTKQAWNQIMHSLYVGFVARYYARCCYASQQVLIINVPDDIRHTLHVHAHHRAPIKVITLHGQTTGTQLTVAALARSHMYTCAM